MKEHNERHKAWVAKTPGKMKAFQKKHNELADDSQSQHAQLSGEAKPHISDNDNDSQFDLDSIELCETEPGDYSLGSKRPSHDYWETTTDVRKRIEEFIRAEKFRSIVSGQARVRNREHGSSIPLPRALDKVMSGHLRHTPLNRQYEKNAFSRSFTQQRSNQA
ncbi:hypothetical protein K450DRAFT_225119 [Umbelopsis ramanniana AG]|uniref:Uncharacterized protein n=1 Tax=Umbelopsis ramanniana AG TaxID=1314678 RepID=A0AAD5HH73_UMBRA|nr:uncharacterized protein K450DRAFT_225119 [Umbelopsis ramanniana AG]KAI8582854.1 hypothetical protein K450DRAFT_225119 [Umbelopsis ramanniana AG]